MADLDVALSSVGHDDPSEPPEIAYPGPSRGGNSTNSANSLIAAPMVPVQPGMFFVMASPNAVEPIAWTQEAATQMQGDWSSQMWFGSPQQHQGSLVGGRGVRQHRQQRRHNRRSHSIDGGGNPEQTAEGTWIGDWQADYLRKAAHVAMEAAQTAREAAQIKRAHCTGHDHSAGAVGLDEHVEADRAEQQEVKLPSSTREISVQCDDKHTCELGVQCDITNDWEWDHEQFRQENEPLSNETCREIFRSKEAVLRHRQLPPAPSMMAPLPPNQCTGNLSSPCQIDASCSALFDFDTYPKVVVGSEKLQMQLRYLQKRCSEVKELIRVARVAEGHDVSTTEPTDSDNDGLDSQTLAVEEGSNSANDADCVRASPCRSASDESDQEKFDMQCANPCKQQSFSTVDNLATKQKVFPQARGKPWMGRFHVEADHTSCSSDEEDLQSEELPECARNEKVQTRKERRTKQKKQKKPASKQQTSGGIDDDWMRCDIQRVAKHDKSAEDVVSIPQCCAMCGKALFNNTLAKKVGLCKIHFREMQSFEKTLIEMQSSQMRFRCPEDTLLHCFANEFWTTPSNHSHLKDSDKGVAFYKCLAHFLVARGGDVFKTNIIGVTPFQFATDAMKHAPQAIISLAHAVQQTGGRLSAEEVTQCSAAEEALSTWSAAQIQPVWDETNRTIALTAYWQQQMSAEWAACQSI